MATTDPQAGQDPPSPCPLCGREDQDRDALRRAVREALGAGALRQLGIYDAPEGFTLSVVIPIYNEQETIREIVGQVRAVPILKEIICVDDYSTDGTRDILPELEGDDLKVFYHERNRGKGAALRTGFAQATGDAVIVQDADLEYNPAEFPRLIQPIIEGKADVVYGSRFIGDTHRVLFYRHYLGNRLLTWLSNMFTDLNLTDMETCYKVFRREVLDGITIKSNRFGFEPEITAKIARGKKWRIYEMPISYSGRTYAEGKKIGLKDFFEALWCIVRFRLGN